MLICVFPLMIAEIASDLAPFCPRRYAALMARDRIAASLKATSRRQNIHRDCSCYSALLNLDASSWQITSRVSSYRATASLSAASRPADLIQDGQTFNALRLIGL